MNRIILIIALFFSFSWWSNGADTTKSGAGQLWETANRYYSTGNFQQALDSYKEIEKTGIASVPLFYNIANSYYKLHDTGRSILYYERALKLDPSNSDVINNIHIARNLVVDKIDVAPEFVLISWIKRLNYTVSSNVWSIISIFALLISLLLWLLFKYGRGRGIRRASFVIAIISSVLWLVSLLFSWSQKQEYFSRDKAIVIQPVSTVRSSPDNSGQTLFILHTGSKVKIIETLSGWIRIELADGRQGWMDAKDSEII